MSNAARARLELVKPASAERIDIYAADKAKIAQIDWAMVHIRGDRALAITLPDRIRRIVRR